MQAADRLKVTWTPRRRLAAAGGLLRLPADAADRATRSRQLQDVDEKLAAAATVVQATYLYPYQMHGSIGTSCAVADVKADEATIWSATQGVYPQRDSCRRCCSACAGTGARDLHARFGLLRHQRRRHRVVRRRAAVAGGRKPGARAAVAQRRDGVGELRHRLRRSTSASASTQRQHRRVGLRSVVAVARRPSRLRSRRATSSRACSPASSRRRSRRGRRRRRRPGRFNNGSNIAPSYVAGCVGGSCGGAGVVKSERVLSHTIRSPFFTGPLRSPSRCRTRSRTSASWTRSRPQVEGRSGRVSPASSARSAAEGGRAGRRGKGRQLGGTTVADAERSQRDRRCRGRGIVVRAVRRRQRYCAMVAEVDVDQASGAST